MGNVPKLVMDIKPKTPGIKLGVFSFIEYLVI